MAKSATASPFFDEWRYGRQTYFEFVQAGTHAVFEKHSPVISDPKMREFRAAARFGCIIDTTLTAPNNWLELPREARAVMTAFDILDSLTSVIANEDRAEKNRRTIESKRNTAPKGRGR